MLNKGRVGVVMTLGLAVTSLGGCKASRPAGSKNLQRPLKEDPPSGIMSAFSDFTNGRLPDNSSSGVGSFVPDNADSGGSVRGKR